MAIINDPDLLLDDSANGDSDQNIFINTALRTIKIRNNAASPDPSNLVLSNDGVTHQALYSFLKKQWKDDPKSKTLIAYPFPLIAITPEQFEWRYGWQPADDSSRSLIRTGGWREYAEDNSTLRKEYIGVISLGNIQGTPREENAAENQHKAYYAFFNGSTNQAITSATDFDYSGEVNQAVQTLDSTAYDYTDDVLRLFIRSEPYVAPQSSTAWTFDQIDTVDIGIPAGTTLPYNTQRFPLVEGTDLNILERDGTTQLTDAVIEAAKDAGQKYSFQGDGPVIDYRTVNTNTANLGYTQDLANGSISIGNTIDATSPTAVSGSLSVQEIYSWVNYKLRQDSDIEFASGTAKIGRLQDELLEFVGPTLITKRARNFDQSGEILNTALINFLGTDVNNIEFRDSDGTPQPFPFSAGVTITFSDEIADGGVNSKGFVYYQYTREYSGTGGVTIASVGDAAANANLDSAIFTLEGTWSTSPLDVAEGLELVDGNRHFKLNGMTTAANNQAILELTAEHSSTVFSARTIDDVALTAETGASATLRTHPINSPSALLVDSAGTDVENTGGVTSTLDTNPIVFNYAFTQNSQKDRLSGASAGPVAVSVRAIGLGNGTWVEALAQILEQDNNNIPVNSGVERNYANP